MKKIKILLILVLSCLCFYLQAQVLFNVRQLTNCNEFQVSLTPNTNYTSPFNLTNSAQVTLVVPTGSVSFNSLTDINGNWTFIGPIITAPPENPSFDYINFQLNNGTGAINYQTGIEVPLFTINTTRNCGAGNVVLMDNNTDPFNSPNSQNINVGNSITILGAGGNAYSGNYGNSGGNTTTPTNPTSTACLIEYQIAQIGNNLFQVSLTPNITWTGNDAFTATAQISIRVPTSTLNIGNIINNIPNVNWTLNSSHISPPENPGWDYYSFGIVNTPNIPYNQGVTVNLFQFENFGACPGSIVLIDNDTDPLMQPNSQNANVEQQITVAGFQMPDAPICVAGSISPTCNSTSTTPPIANNCLIEYQISQIGDNLFQVSLTPDITWTGIDAYTATAQVSIRVPTGTLNIGNIINNIPTVNWTLNSSHLNPPENPGWDYYSFGIVNTQAIPYTQGVTVDLFQFENFGTCPSSIVLIDNDTDPLMQPNSQNANVQQQITVAGFQMPDAPICIAGSISPDCNSTNTPPPLANNCLIEYQIAQVGNNIFQISLTPDITWTGINAYTATAQVSIRVPTGTLNIGNLTNNIPTAIWTLNSSHINPPENPGWDYYSFGLVNTQDIPYTQGVLVNLFQFENFGTCPGSIILIDNDTDPLMQPNSQNANVQQQITVSGWQMPDAPVCVAGGISPTCTNPPVADDCLIEYHLSSVGGNLFQVSLTPDITWTGINALTATGQVSIRVPAGSFSMGNVINNIPTAIWTLNSSYLSPPENPAWDYYSFGLVNTQDIPYFNGQTVDLFQFQNLGTCTGDSIYLIDNATDPLMQPNSQNANIEQQLTVSGWQMEDVPICIDAGTSAACCNCDDTATPPSTMIMATRECMGDATRFTCPINSGVHSVLWNFGDGVGTSTLKNPTYVYQEHGTYLVTLRINYTNGTTTILTKDVIVDPMIWPLVRTIKDTVCVGECVRLQAQGGDTYAWSPITTIDDPTYFSPVVCPTTTTTYTVIISNGLGCSATEDVTVYVSNPPVVQAINDITVCEGEPATLGIANGSGVFQWGPVGSIVNGTIANAIANPTSTTEYCVTVTDTHGCTASDCMVVNVVSNPDASAGTDQEICGGQTAQLNATGGISYQWSPASNITNTAIPNPIVSPTTTTDYCVTVTDNNGCTSTDCVTISVNGISTFINNDATICAGQSTLLSATGGSSYSWSPSAGLNNTSISNPTASPSTSTTYCVTITNAEGCQEEKCIRVTVNSTVTANAGQDVRICKDQPTQLFATGGSIYRWSPSNNLNSSSIRNPIASPAITTTYCVTATDDNGCTDTDCIQVIVENNLVASAGADQTICRGENVVLNASGGTTYIWSPTSGLSNSTVPNPVATPNATTTYCVTITDNNGCVATDCMNIIVDGSITASAGNDVTLCRGNTTQLTASGGTNYSWSPALGLSNSNSSNPIVTANNTTTYCVTVTDASGCEASDCVNVIVENGISASAGNDMTICSGSTAQLVATGGVSYQWSPTTDLNNPNINNPIASPSSSTSYCVTVTSAKGCTSVDCVQVNIGGSLSANAGTDQTICTGSNTQLSASGGTTYQWGPTAGLSNANSRNPIASPTTTTTYCVTVTDGNSCTGVDCVTINIGNSLTANAGSDRSVCLGSSTQLSASGGSNYQWSPSAGLSNTNIANPISTPNTTTIYCVTVTDNEGCTGTDCVRVQVSNSLNANAGNDISVCSGSTTSLNASGGSTYRWLPTTGLSNPNIANPTVNISGQATYCVTVTDGNGCTGTDCVNVTMGNSISANAGNDVSICNGASATLNASGGSTYRWLPTTGLSNPNIANPTVNVSSPTTYCVTVTDGSGCTGIDCVVVNIGETVVANAGSDQRVCVGSSATLNASGGSSYRWFPTSGLSNPNIANPVVNITVPTSYCVTVMENGKCSSVDCVTVDVSGSLTANAGNDISTCNGGSATLNASGGSTYRWSPTTGLSNPNIANPTVSASSSTTYCVTVTDGNGCSGVDCVNVSLGNNINANAGTDQTICRGTSTQLFASGGTTYSWTPAAGISNPNIANPTISPAVTTIYCVNVSNGGCSKTDCVQISVSDQVNANAGSDINTCIGGSVRLNASGGTGYSWSPTTGLSNPNIANPTVTANASAIYCVTVTENGKCAGVDCVNVNLNSSITANAGSDISICSGASASLSASGGNSYRWAPTTGLSNPNISNPTVSVTSTTTYCVTATDSNGCSGIDCVVVSVENGINANAGSDKSICNGTSTQLSASGGTSYSWTPSTGLSNPNIANPMASPSVSTIYCVNISNGNCSEVDCIQVNVSDIVNANAGNDISACSGGSVNLNASGGNGYSWYPTTGLSNPNIANPTVNISVPTTYCVTVTANGKCAGVDCVNVGVSAGLAANAGNDINICNGSSGTLNASGGSTYRWSPTTGLSNPNIANPTVTATSSATYCVTVTDSNGCTGRDCMVVSVGNNIFPNAGSDVSICRGESTKLYASGGTSFSWTPTTGLSNPNSATPTVSPSVTTIYCVNVSNGNCSKTDCVQVNVSDVINANAGNDRSICNGTSTTLSASGGSTYRWSPTAGLSNPNISNPTVNISVPTTYCVTVTEGGKCAGVDCVTVTVNGGSNISAGNDISICNGTSTNLNASGGSTYRWSPSAGLSNPNISNPIVNISTPTTYCVTITDNNGCSGIDCVTVSIGSGANANAGSDMAVCIGSNAQLNASGGNTYRWSPTVGLSNPNIANPTITPTVSNTYCVTVTDNNGCTSQDCLFVSTKKIQSNISSDLSLCAGEKTNLIATGGDFYSWTPTIGLSNPNIAAPIASPTSTITYCATISAEGCSNVECVTITVQQGCNGGDDNGSGSSICNPGVNGVACPDKNICIGETAHLVVNGGNSWSWSPSSSLSNPFIAAPFATPVVTTTYTVTVTDLNGCTDVDQVTVYVDNCGITPNPCSNGTTVVACADKTICPGETTQLTVTTGLTYQWLPLHNLSNPFSGVPFASPTSTTTYSVTVTDENGCMGTDEVTIFVSTDCSPEQTPQPCTETAFVVACEDKFICRGGSIRLNVTTGASYVWSPDVSLSHPNVGAPIARPLETTTYTVTLTDANGCTGTDQVIVYVNEAQAFAGADVSTCGSPVQLNASGGNTYRWSPSAGLSNSNIASPIANPTTTTSYCVTVTDLDGCTDTDCVEVAVGSSFPAVACEDKFICQGANVRLTVTTGASYRWSPSTGLSNVNIGTPLASPSQTTTYTVTVTDAAGCTSVDEVVVNVDPNCTNGRSCPEDILPSSPLTIELSDCQSSGELCLPIERASMSDYIFKINGVEQTEEAFKDCQLNYSFAYTYFTIPDRGNNGPYNLQEWVVDGNTHGGSFNSIEELILLMNAIDPSGNWIADASTLTLKGGHPDVKYSTMSIEQIASNATARLELNTNITPSETIIILPIGTNEVEIMLKETGCIVQSTIQVSCPNMVACSNLFLEDNIEQELATCEDLVEICLEFPLSEAIEYTYLHNGGSFQGNAGFCSLSGTTTALYVEKGEHELIVTHIATGCADTLLVSATCPQAIIEETEPTADTDEVITNVNETIDIDVSANDRSLGSIQSLQIIRHPIKGQVFINEDQSISYQPNEDYCDTEVRDKFTYEICNEYGCDIADVMVKVACKPLSVYTGFSPNGDGINDYFKIEGVEDYPDSRLQVFNRWGTLIYEKKGYQNDWDGRYKSNPLADGVYFYLFMDGYGNKQSGYIQISR